ncbi:glycosyltransferase family 2 protein [archaeon]|jgi:GT2 family glycosyltransferase|nr:glycosyltransferase family 2 protein [archaeon]
MNPSPSVGIIIINWNGLEDTIELINSIANINYKNYKIFLVDNNSSDGSQQKFKEKYLKNKKITLIFNKTNLGLAGGFNSGLKKSLKEKFNYSFIMNNDMVVDKNFLSLLILEMEKNKKLAAAGPRIYYYSDKKRIWNTGVKFNLIGFKNSFQNELDYKVNSKNKIVDALDGAYLIRNSLLNKICLLEKDFFIMHEMSGWCIKANQRGYFSMIIPKSKIWHKVSRSVKEVGPLCAYYGSRNWLLLLKRTQPKLNYIIGSIIYFSLIFPRFIYSKFKGRKFYLTKIIKGAIDSFSKE